MTDTEHSKTSSSNEEEGAILKKLSKIAQKCKYYNKQNKKTTACKEI